jgi:hypothetical protein
MERQMADRPPMWMLLRDAIDARGGKATYSELKDHIRAKYGAINDSSLTCEIISCSVNHPSRIHYPANKKPRAATSQYDFLFNVGRGRVEAYNPELQGEWEIFADEYGNLGVRQKDLDEQQAAEEEIVDAFYFPFESHLRDFIARNLQEVRPSKTKLHLYESPEKRDGIEFPTDVGPIDILARDDKGGFVVFELKLHKGPDAALGQILRYMGWVKKHLANGAPVSGVIVASEITDKLKYAVSLVPSIALYAYKVKFDLTEEKLL